jgi:hypothetical protein
MIGIRIQSDKGRTFMVFGDEPHRTAVITVRSGRTDHLGVMVYGGVRADEDSPNDNPTCIFDSDNDANGSHVALLPNEVQKIRSLTDWEAVGLLHNGGLTKGEASLLAKHIRKTNAAESAGHYDRDCGRHIYPLE